MTDDIQDSTATIDPDQQREEWLGYQAANFHDFCTSVEWNGLRDYAKYESENDPAIHGEAPSDDFLQDELNAVIVSIKLREAHPVSFGLVSGKDAWQGAQSESEFRQGYAEAYKRGWRMGFLMKKGALGSVEGLLQEYDVREGNIAPVDNLLF